jgi:hypothetical protein
MNEARLQDILRLKRGHGSLGEQMMIDEVIMPYEPEIFYDPKGITLAYHIQVGNTKTLFSAHTDTVHGRSLSKLAKIGGAPAQEDPHNDIDVNLFTNMISAKGDVLGADDGAGLWLLLEMIDAGVPGSYLLHRGEECGGIGSRGMAAHWSDFIKTFDRAIAFDRKGTHSVITHQSRGRCCSDEFAVALSAALGDDTYFFQPDDGGVFTDTANYTDDIGECTNVSIGYFNEHTHNESLDLDYLFNLRKVCLTVDWEALPSVRKAGECDPADHYGYNWRGGSYSGMSMTSWNKEFEYYNRKGANASSITLEDVWGMEFEDMVDLCIDYPESAAEIMYELLWGAPADHDSPVNTVGDDDDAEDPRLALGMR